MTDMLKVDSPFNCQMLNHPLTSSKLQYLLILTVQYLSNTHTNTHNVFGYLAFIMRLFPVFLIHPLSVNNHLTFWCIILVLEYFDYFGEFYNSLHLSVRITAGLYEEFKALRFYEKFRSQSKTKSLDRKIQSHTVHYSYK